MSVGDAIADAIMTIEVEGQTVEVVDESKLPLFKFDCGRGHPHWHERKPLAQGHGWCKECRKEADEYNNILKEKGYNWPVALSHIVHGKLINKGEDAYSTRTATLADRVEGK